MENKQTNIEKINSRLKRIEKILKEKGIIEEDLNKKFLADEKLLGEDWLSEEDEEAWKDL